MARPDNSSPRDDELEALAGDVRYEIDLFRYASSGGLRRALSVDDANLIKEAMLIHARCLVDFFLCKPVKDDVVADRYADWDPERDGDEELKWLEEKLGTFIDKRVAHITAYRQRVPKSKDAQLVATVQGYMERVITRFLSNVHTDKRTWFDQ